MSFASTDYHTAATLASRSQEYVTVAVTVL